MGKLRGRFFSLIVRMISLRQAGPSEAGTVYSISLWESVGVGSSSAQFMRQSRLTLFVVRGESGVVWRMGRLKVRTG